MDSQVLTIARTPTRTIASRLWATDSRGAKPSLYFCTDTTASNVLRLPPPTERSIRHEADSHALLPTPTGLAEDRPQSVQLYQSIQLPQPVQLSQPIQLYAHTLGTFRVTVGDKPMPSWPKGRGLVILKYLLTHHRRPVPRDILMDLSWPDARIETARNRLNNAVCMLRRSLAGVTKGNLIDYEAGAYRLAPNVTVWLDCEAFEADVERGRALDAAGDEAGAGDAYARALDLYRGDFLADDLYEDWPTAFRVHLRRLCLEALDRLSALRFAAGRWSESAQLCLRLLSLDPCHEAAHVQLMRVYARQGHYALAIRQLHACLAALEELGCAPGAELLGLGRMLREREPV